MSRPLPRPAVAALVAALLWTASRPAPAQTIAPAPVPGPVGLSVGNESRIAILRAERWLARHAPGDGVPALPASPDDAVLDGLLPLLQNDFSVVPPGSNLHETWYLLATGLARRGEPVVFLPDGTSIPWRNAVLHALVSSQRPDDRGGGWWSALPDAGPEAESDAYRSTRAAHATLLFLLGEPGP